MDIDRCLTARAVEVYDPPSQDLPELFRTTGRYRHGYFITIMDTGCVVDFCHPYKNAELVPCGRIYRQRRLCKSSEACYALVRIAKNEPLTWVPGTLLCQVDDDYIEVDVVISGQVKVLFATVMSAESTPGACLGEEELRAMARFPSKAMAPYITDPLSVPTRPSVKRKIADEAFVPDYFAKIHPDLLVKIAQQLDYTHQMKFRRLSRTWKSVLQTSAVRNVVVFDGARFRDFDRNSSIRLINWEMHSALLPYVQHVIIDCQDEDIDWYLIRCIVRTFRSCIRKRGLRLESLVLVGATGFIFGDCEEMEQFGQIADKIRFKNCKIHRPRWSCECGGVRIHAEDEYIMGHGTGSTTFRKLCRDLLNRLCGNISPLSSDEIRDMEALAQNEAVTFSARVRAMMREGEILELANGDPKFGNMDAYAVTDLRHAFKNSRNKRVRGLFDYLDEENDEDEQDEDVDDG